MLTAPFPYFGGKRSIATEIWSRFGRVKQYIEPFCGSAAILLAAPKPASLEVICDQNFYVANFWRATKHQPEAVAHWADYPVSHIDQSARHRWLLDPARTAELRDALLDADWPGDAKIAGWWLWGQCSWIGSGWCEIGQVPHAGNAGMGVQAIGKIPHASDAGRGVQAIGKIPHASDAGRGGTFSVASTWLANLARRLERVRVQHGDWSRSLNHHYGGTSTAVFLDPPYREYEALYGCAGVADDVETWARDHGELRIALCGHRGDYRLPGWDEWTWSRGRLTYGGAKTTNRECVWFSPACESRKQTELFG